MRYCARCKEMVPEEAVRRRLRRADEEPSLLPDEPDVFAIRVALELSIDAAWIARETREVLYHIRFVTRGCGGGRCGSHRETVNCGPLRDPTPAELSAYEEEGRWEAMFGRTAMTK